MNKYCYFGPAPMERDGGMIVNYYLQKKQNQIRPMDEYHAIPKVPEELDASRLPWINYYTTSNPVETIPRLMLGQEIPLLNIFHIGRNDIERLIEPVHNIGGKIVLHQTIHWLDDDIFKSNRLDELDRIVAPTNYAKGAFQTVAKIPPEKITTIPHGVDLQRYYKHDTVLERQWGIDKSRQKVILFSGRLSYWKGVAQIIPIMRQLASEFNCVFIIRASPFQGIDESFKLAYVFDRLSNNNPNVIFIPEWQSFDFMEELYAMTDILISNVAHEGFNVPLIEAQAVGAVPVTTAQPPHIEILGRTGFCGMLLEPRVEVGMVNDDTILKVCHEDQLYGALKWLLENPTEAKVMGLRGRKNVEERFDLNKVALQWLQLYDDMVEGKSMDTVLKERIMYE